MPHVYCMPTGEPRMSGMIAYLQPAPANPSPKDPNVKGPGRPPDFDPGPFGVIRGGIFTIDASGRSPGFLGGAARKQVLGHIDSPPVGGYARACFMARDVTSRV